MNGIPKKLIQKRVSVLLAGTSLKPATSANKSEVGVYEYEHTNAFKQRRLCRHQRSRKQPRKSSRMRRGCRTVQQMLKSVFPRRTLRWLRVSRRLDCDLIPSFKNRDLKLVITARAELTKGFRSDRFTRQRTVIVKDRSLSHPSCRRFRGDATGWLIQRGRDKHRQSHGFLSAR